MFLKSIKSTIRLACRESFQLVGPAFISRQPHCRRTIGAWQRSVIGFRSWIAGIPV